MFQKTFSITLSPMVFQVKLTPPGCYTKNRPYARLAPRRAKSAIARSTCEVCEVKIGNLTSLPRGSRRETLQHYRELYEVCKGRVTIELCYITKCVNSTSLLNQQSSLAPQVSHLPRGPRKPPTSQHTSCTSDVARLADLAHLAAHLSNFAHLATKKVLYWVECEFNMVFLVNTGVSKTKFQIICFGLFSYKK